MRKRWYAAGGPRPPHPTVRPAPGWRTAALAAWLLAAPLLGGGETATDPLAERGVAVTGGVEALAQADSEPTADR